MSMNLFFQYLLWQFFEMPKQILKGWWNILACTINYFSLLLLLQTFFSPWRKISWTYEKKGFQPGLLLEILLSNFISRIIGALIRIVVIAAGLACAVLVCIAGGVALIGWFTLPLLIIWSFYHGYRTFTQY